MLDVNLNKVLGAILGPLDPAPEFSFWVEIDGMVEGAFTECTAVKADREVVAVRQGGSNNYVYHLPGRITYGDITLRRGIMFSSDLWKWFMKGDEKGNVKKRDLTIIQYSSYFNLPARWYHIKDAFPISWEGANLRSDSSGLAMESLTLTFDYIELEEWSAISLAAKLIPQ